MDIETLIADNLFAKYRHSPNILKVLEIIAVPFQDTIDAVEYLQTQNDVTVAEGVHLDAIGELIGVERPLEQEPNDFRFIDIGDLPGDPTHHGFCDIDGDPTGGYLVSSYNGLASVTNPGELMSDADYLELILFKISNFRQRATEARIYLSLVLYGVTCDVETITNGVIDITPQTPGEMTYYQRWYLLNKGFRPAGIKINVNMIG
jgi:hypothetical protein